MGGNASEVLPPTNSKTQDMKKVFSIFLALTITTLVYSCKPDEEACTDATNSLCPNYDPCTVAVAASSDFDFVFQVENAVGDTIIDLSVDTTYGGSPVLYRALTPGLSSYSWRVGADPRTFNEQELKLNFTGFSGNISVTLETLTTNSDFCLEEWQLQDVQTKQIYYAARGDDPAFFGAFRGSILGASDEQEYDVQLGDPLPPYDRLYGLPLPDDCVFNDRGIPLYADYQAFVSTFTQEGPTPRCRNLTVVGRIDKEDSDLLRIEYVYDDDDGSRKEVVFEGRRQ